MRERVRHGEVGRRQFDGEGVERRAGGRFRAWRRGAGPRPVRPGVVSVGVRPPEAPRPVAAAGWPSEQRGDGSGGPRLLLRRPVAAPSQHTARYRLRRAVAGLVLVAASAAVVVALGLLVRLVEPVPPAPPAPVSAAVGAPAPVVVTAEPGETVWEVADRVAPGLSGPRRAALAERIAADNALSSVRLQPGQVLRVATG